MQPMTTPERMTANMTTARAELSQLIRLIPSDRVKFNEPMVNYTSFKIGGPADALVIPHSAEELVRVLTFCREQHIPHYVIGRGTNLLVLDKGIRGVVIVLGKYFSQVEVIGNLVEAGAGISLTDLSHLVAERELAGLEFAVGIPGSLGGAVVMNAGAYGGEMSHLVEAVKIVNPAGQIVTLNKEEMQYGYRRSILLDNENIVISVRLRLKPGKTSEIKAKMADFTKRRESRQPMALPSAGSVFKRPEGHYVGPMIESLGLKGYRVGDAQVSDLHAGFIVNLGQATAGDVLKLINHIQQAVAERFKVHLIPEIRIVGESKD